MKKTRFTEAQIVVILRELDAGVPAVELGRKHGIHANTIRLWRDKYGGMETSDLVKLRQLEDENRRKDRIIAETRSREGAPRTRHLGGSRVRSHRLQPQQSVLST